MGKRKVLSCYKDFYIIDGDKAFSKGRDYPVLSQIKLSDEPAYFLVINDDDEEHIMFWAVKA